MGIRGLSTLLEREGWLPPSTRCGVTLWRDAALLSDDSSHRIERLPPQSTLAIDGFGLVFHVLDVAYARHFAQVCGSSSSSTPTRAERCSCSTKHLSEAQITHLLPPFMPLSLVEEVTNEFITSLLRNQMNLVVYFDGKDTRMKALTTSKRNDVKDTERSCLQQYCLYGIINRSTTNKSLCQRDLMASFPKPRLICRQVIHTISQRTEVTIVDCDGEADADIARASADNPHCYCVGRDTDFCLFPRARYVPLNTLDASGSVVSGCVITRAELAIHLDLPTDQAMVELGILMGNDYVGDPSKATLDFSSPDLNNILNHLRARGPYYQVTSKSPQVQLRLDFTRALFEFGDLHEFPLDDDSLDEDGDEESDGNAESDDDDDSASCGECAEIPCDLTLADLKPLDFSLADVVMRPLQAYVDVVDGDDEEHAMIRQEHLDAFQKMIETLTTSRRNDRLLESSRPKFADVVAADLIERIVSHIMRSNPSAPAVRLSSPAKMFDHLLFHAILSESRKGSELPAHNVDDCQVLEAQPPTRSKLPIDEFEADILDAVESQRVTIIHGETGCGKSSRVPAMLLRAPPPDPTLQSVRMFISQPRRIAAKSLVERVRSCEPDLKHLIALRMGHGVREYESSQTRAWFVTTGYLVRLLANHPEKFNDCSHLIIDEVHERSVDTDILCLLCRRLLDSNPRIRLILMSATMAATLYQQYFGVPQPPIHVGARRFPIKEYYMDDIKRRFRFPPADMKAAKAIENDCEKHQCLAPPSNTYMTNLNRLTVRVIVSIARPGSSILIFVPGMNEIISITELVEKLYIPAIRFKCYPIHSDVPFDEQMSAFTSPAIDEVKVVIATNAAESSVTLPDVDDVICLGLCKQIVYNPASHRQMLTPAWISKASATQRAGRTGRVREGNVYRLYTREAFDEHMQPFETGEMLRIPLDTVILTLKEMLKEEATPVLMQCLEPPDLSTIDRSFESLSRSNFITLPNDRGKITMLGSFVSSLGIDLTLGSLIGLGIQFGVGAEAVEMAAVLSFPQTPWMITNPLFHEPHEFNAITATTYSSRCHFDANLYSEPLAVMNLMWDYDRASNKHGWSRYYSVAASRVQRLITTRNSLRKRVAGFVGIDVENLTMEKPPAHMSHAKVTMLRVIQVWVFSDTMIESTHVPSTNSDGSVSVTLTGDQIEHTHLSQVLSADRHAFVHSSNRTIDQQGSFIPVSDDDFDFNSFIPEFECRFLSYVIEMEFSIAWYETDDSFHLFVTQDLLNSEQFSMFRSERLGSFEESRIVAKGSPDGKGHGRKVRPCGLWSIRYVNTTNSETQEQGISMIKLSKSNKKHIARLSRSLRQFLLEIGGGCSTLSCAFTQYKKKIKRCFRPHVLLVSGGRSSPVSMTDLRDLFATPTVEMRTLQSGKCIQRVTFAPTPNTPIPYRGKVTGTVNTAVCGENSSWRRPLLPNIPEGARLLSVIASGRRKDHSIRFPPIEEKKEEAEIAHIDDVAYLEVCLNRDETKIAKRWCQFASNRQVYISENCVPASAVCLSKPTEVFACCANTLEVRGGCLRVEGLTLLPPGRLFPLLSFLTFGLRPFAPGRIVDEETESLEENESSACRELTAKAIQWLRAWDNMVPGLVNGGDNECNAYERIQWALAFHDTCEGLGEELVCHPDKVKALCKVFDKVDGYSVVPWDSLDSNPFIASNLLKGGDHFPHSSKVITTSIATNEVMRVTERREIVNKAHRATTISSSDREISLYQNSNGASVGTTPGASAEEDISLIPDGAIPMSAGTGSKRTTTVVGSYSEEVLSIASRLFATTMDPNETVGECVLPSTNILSILIRHHCDALLQNIVSIELHETQQIANVSLSGRHWTVHSLTGADGKEWFMAMFVANIMPPLPRKKGSSRLAEWILQGKRRPRTAKLALACVPPRFATIPYLEKKISLGTQLPREKVVLFESLEMALRMESAFWLDLQFGEPSRHWFQQPLEDLIGKAAIIR